ncbi:MAG: RelA/SpoT family protein [Bacteroidales bacterium]
MNDHFRYLWKGKSEELREQKIYSMYKALLVACRNSVPAEELPLVRKALKYLIDTAGETKTISGELLVNHSLNVARFIAADLGLGTTTVIGALLHDTPGLQGFEKKTIHDDFGVQVALILEGFSKITSIDSRQSSYQAENFRKLLLSLADDVRVIIIKLVERLEDMRNLDNVVDKERLTIASETYFLYAPIAHRLGFYNLKSELEDLSVKYLEPEQYTAIGEKLKQTASSRNKLIREFLEPIKKKLDRQGIRYAIKSRTKSIHSIMLKMKKQGVEFEEVFDIFAIRIIIDSKPETEKSDCWQVYSLVTDLYKPNPSRMRDWISLPKSSGYESLHTTVMGPRGRWVEVQIRSLRMDEVAEKGLAAHYRYKGLRSESSLDSWLTRMREILETSAKDDSSFIDHIRSGLYSDEIFVFTPKGDLRQLQAGATVLDFAFEIHTQVGSTCVGGKVNGKNVTIRHILQNGDQVSVLTSRNQKPKRDWLSFVVTSKARTRIKQVLNEEKALAASEGKEVLMRRLKNWKIAYGDAVISKLQSHYQLKTAQDLYFLIATEKIDLLEIKEILLKPVEQAEQSQTGFTGPEKDLTELAGSQFSDFLIIEDKIEGLDYKLSKCCSPVFGDRIFGFVTISEGIKIHRAGCPNAQNMIARYPYRIVAARWTHVKNMPSFRAAVKISGIEDLGIVNRIADIIAEYKVSLRSFNYTMDEGLFEGVLYIMVPNNNVLQGIIKKIISIKGVLRAIRVENE